MPVGLGGCLGRRLASCSRARRRDTIGRSSEVTLKVRRLYKLHTWAVSKLAGSQVRVEAFISGVLVAGILVYKRLIDAICTDAIAPLLIVRRACQTARPRAGHGTARRVRGVIPVALEDWVAPNGLLVPVCW